MPNPYIVGTAVIGKRFYGREALIDRVLNSERHCFCLMGNLITDEQSLQIRNLEELEKRLIT